jgi:hypothetical protein
MHTAVRDNFSLITMKTIASLAIAALTLTASPAVQAHDHHHHSCGNRPIIIGGGFGVSFAPRYVSTRELYRSIQTQWGYDSWGNLVTYNVLTITYADFYSNGTSRTYTRTYRV